MNIARASNQITLLSVAPEYCAWNNASARTAYGAAAQDIAAAVLNLRIIPINGNCDVCFDAEDDTFFYEIKSVRKGCKVVIYDWRMVKEAKTKLPLKYAIVIHQIQNQRQNILQKMVDSLHAILVLPAKKVHALAWEQPHHQVTSHNTKGRRNGYRRGGYAGGYRNVPIWALKDLAPKSESVTYDFYGEQRTVTLLT